MAYSSSLYLRDSFEAPGANSTPWFEVSFLLGLNINKEILIPPDSRWCSSNLELFSPPGSTEAVMQALTPPCATFSIFSVLKVTGRLEKEKSRIAPTWSPEIRCSQPQDSHENTGQNYSSYCLHTDCVRECPGDTVSVVLNVSSKRSRVGN
jgi:hypothetical protein